MTGLWLKPLPSITVAPFSLAHMRRNGTSRSFEPTRELPTDQLGRARLSEKAVTAARAGAVPGHPARRHCNDRDVASRHDAAPHLCQVICVKISRVELLSVDDEEAPGWRPDFGGCGLARRVNRLSFQQLRSSFQTLV